MAGYIVNGRRVADAPRTILVIGAGVGGAVCAIQLRRLGLDVTIAEKESFPRDKVCGCCIGGAGLTAFAQLGLRDWLTDHGIATDRWLASIGGRTVELALPDGVAISRPTLDTALLRKAESAGAVVLQPARVTIEEVTETFVDVSIARPDDTYRQRFGLVVMAGGLNAAGLNQVLPWRDAPHGPFGVSLRAEISAVESGVIYMACDDDGYVGLVRLEDGCVDVAAALTSGSASAASGSPRDRVAAILERSQFRGIQIDGESPLLTTPPLRRSRPAGVARLLTVGDAAGYVEPFTGEGMTWAALSAIDAAEMIASENHWSGLGNRWDRRSRRLLRKKKLACRTITSALRFGVTRRVAGRLLSQWPSLAKPLVNDLNA